MPRIQSRAVRFGPFELDPQLRELKRHGRLLKLQDQPLEVLLALVEQPGQLVTREQLRHRLWPHGTFVAFEDGLNTAVMRLREALSEIAGRPRYIETRTRYGYRFIGHIVESPPDSSVIGLRSIGVLPLRNLSADPDDDQFADAMTEELTTRLARVSSLRVVSRSSVMQFKDTRAPMSEIGRVLGVDALVAGAIVRSGHRVRVTAQLVEAAADRHLWADSYERDLCEVLALQHDLAVAIAGEVRASLAARQRFSVAPPSVVNPEAYFAYIKGRACWDQRNERALLRGIDEFTQAIDVDPQYAAAYAGMADCYTALGYGSYLAPRAAFEHAAAAAHKALVLDPESADAEAVLGYVALYYDWNYNEADRRFQRALAIDSNSVTAHHWYSVYLTAAGRVEDARTEIRHAQALDPLSPAVATDVGFGAYYAGRFDEAIASLRTVLAVAPNYPLAHLWLGRTYQEQGRFSDAAAAFSETLKVLGDWPVALAAQGFVFGVSGRREAATEVLQRLYGLAAQKYVTEYGVALVHAGLGDREAAFEWLDRAVTARSHWLVWLKLDPRWASLKSDRRFARLLVQIGVGP